MCVCVCCWVCLYPALLCRKLGCELPHLPALLLLFVCFEPQHKRPQRARREKRYTSEQTGRQRLGDIHARRATAGLRAQTSRSAAAGRVPPPDQQRQCRTQTHPHTSPPAANRRQQRRREPADARATRPQHVPLPCQCLPACMRVLPRQCVPWCPVPVLLRARGARARSSTSTCSATVHGLCLVQPSCCCLSCCLSCCCCCFGGEEDCRGASFAVVTATPTYTWARNGCRCAEMLDGSAVTMALSSARLSFDIPLHMRTCVRE